MQLQKLHQVVAGGVNVGETVGVPEDAAADHEAVYFGILRVEFADVGEVFDVAVHDEGGFRA